MIQLTAPARPAVQDLLVQTGWAKSVGGSLRGWSALQLMPKCPRLAYLQMVCGLQSQKPSDAMDQGVLYHACMESHYASGGRDTLGPLRAVESAVPEIAANVRRLIDAKFRRYGVEEAETWDIRAVEHEVIARVKGKARVGAYRRRVIEAPVSSKFDLIIAKRERNGPYAQFGPVKTGVWAFDHKTTGRLSRDKVGGFGMDPQFLLMAYNWRKARLDRVFGPLLGFIIEIVVATKEVGIERIEVRVDDRDADRYIQEMSSWFVDIESMLALPPEERARQELWPMNFAGCRQAYGLCKYFDLCESHGAYRSLYTVAEGFVPAKALVEQRVRHRRVAQASEVPLTAPAPGSHERSQ